jgi:hypothetical protein
MSAEHLMLLGETTLSGTAKVAADVEVYVRKPVKTGLSVSEVLSSIPDLLDSKEVDISCSLPNELLRDHEFLVAGLRTLTYTEADVKNRTVTDDYRTSVGDVIVVQRCLTLTAVTVKGEQRDGPFSFGLHIFVESVGLTELE